MRLVNRWRYTDQMTMKELAMRCRCTSHDIEMVCSGNVTPFMIGAIERAMRSIHVPLRKPVSRTIRFLDARLGYFSKEAIDLGLRNIPTRAERSRMEARILFAETLYLEYLCRRKIIKKMNQKRRQASGWYIYDRWTYGKCRSLVSR